MKTKIMMTLAAGIMVLGALAAQPAEARHCHRDYDRGFCRDQWRGAYLPPNYYRNARWERYGNYGNPYGYYNRGFLSRFF